MSKQFCVTGTCVPEKNYMVDISERIEKITKDYIETRLYNLFLSEELTNSAIYQSGERDKNQFIKDNVLNMELVLEKIYDSFP